MNKVEAVTREEVFNILTKLSVLAKKESEK